MLKEIVYQSINSSEIIAIVEDRVFSKKLKEKCLFPAITYQRIIDNTEQHLKGMDKEKGIFQISLYSKNELELENLFRVLKESLKDKAVYGNAVDFYESDTALHSIKVDYQFYYKD